MYSQAVKSRLLNPQRVVPLFDPTHKAQLGDEGGGPFMALWLVFEADLVIKAAWALNGCPAMIAAASAVAELSENQIAARVVHLNEDHILGDHQLPNGKEYAVAMALELVRMALQAKNDG